jgi:uncharacterized membrane protein
MPDIAALHPQVVHFVVASIFVGLPLYLLSFAGPARFVRTTATILLIVATGAAWIAVVSGDQAHEQVERIPGTTAAVATHEELGELTRNLLSGLLVVELIGLLLARSAVRVGDSVFAGERAGRRRTAATAVQVVVAVGWIAAAGVLFEAAEHGGDLVYGHAGGVGTRPGDAAGVERLLLAGLYNQSVADRRAGRREDAARLVEEMARRFPEDLDVRILLAESLVLDRGDGRAALDALAQLPPVAAADPEEEDDEDDGLPTPAARRALIAADAYLALAMPDSARVVLLALPESERARAPVAERLRRVGG